MASARAKLVASAFIALVWFEGASGIGPSVVGPLVDSRRFGDNGRATPLVFLFESRLRLGHGTARVVVRVGLVLRAVVRKLSG